MTYALYPWVITLLGSQLNETCQVDSLLDQTYFVLRIPLNHDQPRS